MKTQFDKTTLRVIRIYDSSSMMGTSFNTTFHFHFTSTISSNSTHKKWMFLVEYDYQYQLLGSKFVPLSLEIIYASLNNRSCFVRDIELS